MSFVSCSGDRGGNLGLAIAIAGMDTAPLDARAATRSLSSWMSRYSSCVAPRTRISARQPPSRSSLTYMYVYSSFFSNCWYFLGTFERPVLSCIETKLCKYILAWKLLTIYTLLHSSEFENSAKFRQTFFSKFCWFFAIVQLLLPKTHNFWWNISGISAKFTVNINIS